MLWFMVGFSGPVSLTADGVVIGFESELYRVQAGEEVAVVVAVLAGELEGPIELSIRSEDGTARGEELYVLGTIIML